ncbi:MAG: CRISPR-associated protein Csx3 [Bacteroidetes bacterium]|nr:CRISPR-associated protein Csx3 [Bacteroidota bacterium]
MTNRVDIDLGVIYSNISNHNAKLEDLDKYVKKAEEMAGEGNIVVLTGSAPIWMYLKIAHALHGKAKKLLYSSPGQGILDFEVFNHDAF